MNLGRRGTSDGMGAMADVTVSALLYRDPIFDGAADPTVTFNPHEDAWWMVYTNRRTTIAHEEGLVWLFGSDLGVASSDDRARPGNTRRSSIQVAELTVTADRLVCDRDRDVVPSLGL